MRATPLPAIPASYGRPATGGPPGFIGGKDLQVPDWGMIEVLKEFEKRYISSFADPYKLSSFFLLNDPVRLFVNPLPRTNGNKFDLFRVFDPVYDSERAHSQTS